MQNKFQVLICSDLDYEEMVADVCYENHTIAMITQENGISNMKIEIFPPDEGIKSWVFSLNDFIEIIEYAKKCLTDMEKLSEE